MTEFKQKGRDSLKNGRIIKALSGFYYIQSEDGKIYQTKPRGIFRKRNESPLVGDEVKFSASAITEGTLEEISQRSNQLTRPTVANVDIGVIIMSLKDPDFSTSLLDRYLVSLEQHHIQPVIWITKTDLADEKEYEKVKVHADYYRKIGYEVILPERDKVLEQVEVEDLFGSMITKRLAVFLGQSGAGKSTLLNRLDANLQLKIGETSKSLGRGRHTTRHVELVPLLGGLIADTPGFSAIEFDDIAAADLAVCFPEIWETGRECRFKGCVHQNEPNCAVKTAVNKGTIAQHRYDHYLSILEEIQNRKPRYGKKRGS
ncbi:Ribosome small subunit-stimulated GTPase EngC [Alkalibacterium sp. AK22]|uniref:ribosome small subunit-dependent GTPase A n=1 Tax=Alkalibacterium sp. AK22 TaxID=1229520 RepID=UPI0004467F8B|nr:ribosome small subunit-dependent GTPase A [Alkalibacterium sp. AK22]EXJ24225.1 Ribosome small subunit-stimulated GTPase EngC [Alkalibacterium sp. AK22]